MRTNQEREEKMNFNDAILYEQLPDDIEIHEVQSYISNPDIKGKIHADKFGTEFVMTIKKGVLCVDVKCKIDHDELDFCFYVFNGLDTIFEGRYVRNPHFEYKLDGYGDYSCRIFVKYHNQSYKHSDALITKRISYYPKDYISQKLKKLSTEERKIQNIVKMLIICTSNGGGAFLHI